MSLAMAGDASQISECFRDLKTGESDDSYSFFPDDMICFDLGKADGSKGAITVMLGERIIC